MNNGICRQGPAYAKNPARQAQGARAHRDGRCFEEILDASCLWYRAQGTAHIQKTPEPMKDLGPAPGGHGRRVAYHTAKAQPDYKGTLRGGQAVVFEAKFTDEDRLRRDRLTKTQMDDLEAHCLLGAKTFVAVSFGFRDYYRIPWELWRDMKDRFGRMYIMPRELADYRIRFSGNLLYFLEGLENENKSISGRGC